MKEVVCTEYGLPDAFELKEVAMPEPKGNDVLVEVHATSVTTHNLALVTGRPFFVRVMARALRTPKIRTPGSDVAGVVAAVGGDAKLLREGDEVFGDLSLCGFGALAEYVCVPENTLTPKPRNITFREAAAVPQAAVAALQGLRDKGRIQRGQSVLICGASGGLGTFAVQIAKCLGAEVTAVCSAESAEMVRSLGADHVIDYTKEDFTRNGRLYDLILGIAYRPIWDVRRALGPHGTYVSVGGPSLKRILQDMVLGRWLSTEGGKRLVGGWMLTPNKDLGLICGLIENGTVRPVVDRCFQFAEAAAAFRYYAQGHSRGKVVITISAGDGNSR